MPSWALPAVVGLAIALRVAHVLTLRATPWFAHLVVDPEYYDEWARRIAAGDWLGSRSFYMDPLYPYVLGALYALLGRDLLVARLLNVAFSAGSCALVAVIGRRIADARVGLIAALGFALYKPEIFYSGEIDKTCLSVLLAAASLALWFEPTPVERLAAGGALALTSLTRANFLLFAPFAALVQPTSATPAIRRRLASAGVLLGGFALVLLPVAWRNHHVSGEWVLTTAQAGQNFYTGNNPTNPYGAYGAVPFVRGNPHFEEADFRSAAEERSGRQLGSAEVSRFWFGEAFEHMQAHPDFAARAMLRKLALFWNDFEISDNQDQYLIARKSWVIRLPLPGFGAVASLALLGAIAGWRARRDVRLLCGFVALYCLSVVAFFIFSRYRIQVVPALLPLAALGAVELWKRARSRDFRRVAPAAAAVAAAAVFSFHTIGIFTPDHPQVVEMRLRHLGEVELIAGSPNDAIAAFREALERCPTLCPQSLERLADTYIATRRFADAESYFRDYTARYPEQAEGRRQLDRVLEAEHTGVKPASRAAAPSGAPP